ncbi:hypothetical protein [Burkholderia stabilis]|uniref:hypothetical protein n=1 Tax=Burkholderia stabilis TaxID=95485 RepID=UPI00080B6FAD|nr:hypothetical protein [Burkholderia stabilis]
MRDKDSLPYSISATSDSACQGVETNQVALLPLTAVLIDSEGSGASVANQPIVFAVDNAQDQGIPGVWSTESGSWSTSTTVTTTTTGLASVLVKAGTANGCFKIEARQAQAENSPAVFTLEVGARLPDNTHDVDKLVMVEGDQQAAFLNSKAFPSPLVVKALDVNSKSVSNARISFQVNGSTGCTVQPPSPVITDVNGLTPAMQVVVGEQSGLFTIVATANGKEATFDLALAPEESQFRFHSSKGNPIRIYLEPGPASCLGVSLIDAHGTGWPYISVYAVAAGSNFTPQLLGPYPTTRSGSVPLSDLRATTIQDGFLSVWVDKLIRHTYDLKVYQNFETPAGSKVASS